MGGGVEVGGDGPPIGVLGQEHPELVVRDPGARIEAEVPGDGLQRIPVPPIGGLGAEDRATETEGGGRADVGESAVVQDHQPVADLFELGEQVRGDEHRPPLPGDDADQRAPPMPMGSRPLVGSSI